MLNKYFIDTESVETQPGCWNYTRVKIFRENGIGILPTFCGEYIREYSTMYNTFVPFMKDGKEYALFSDDYTKTSVMTLPDCVKIATERPSYYRPVKNSAGVNVDYDTGHKMMTEDIANGVPYNERRVREEEGFCPVDFYVPESETELEYPFHYEEYEDESGNKRRKYVKDSEIPELVYTVYNEDARYAFVAGCIWGDDTSWKIERLDLSEIENGLVKRTDDFGYVEKAPGIPLCDAITIYEEDNEEGQENEAYIYLAVTNRFTVPSKYHVDKVELNK